MKKKEKVDQIVSEIFGSNVKQVKESESGISHSTFFVNLEDKEVVVKISESDWEPLPDFEKGFENDAPVIREIKKRSSVPVPEIYDFDNSEKTYDFKYLVAERIEGKNLTDFFTYRDHKNLIKQLGRLLAELHQIDFPSSGSLEYDSSREKLGVEERDWKSMFEEMVWVLTGHLEDSEYEHFKPRIRKLAEENIDLVEGLEEPVLVHQEMSGGNVIATQDEIKGIIDWERAFSGDPEFDLFTTGIQISQKLSQDKAGLRQNAEEIQQTLRESYAEKRDLRSGWQKRKYLYQLPFIAQMMWVMEDREGKHETLERQLEKVEKELE